MLVIAATGAFLGGCGSANEGLDSSAPTPESVVGSDFFGVNGDVMFVRILDGKAPTIAGSLESLGSSELAFVRSSIDWRRLEPNDPNDPALNPAFDFRLHDAWVGALATHHLRWAPTLLGTPIPDWAADPKEYAECGSRAPPADPSSFARLSAALAKRYGRDGDFWIQHPTLPYEPVTQFEIWNEPNFSSFWCPRPDPARFARLTIAASAAIKRIDPKATVVLGGLAGFTESDTGPKPTRMSPGDFLDAAVAEGPALIDAVDAVGIHPYAPTPDQVLSALQLFRARIDATLPGVPLIVNEVGWPTAGTSGGFTVLPEQTRAGYMTALTEGIAARSDDLGIGQMAPYSWITAQLNQVDEEDWFGLADPQTGAPYPSGEAYLSAVDQLSSAP